MNILVLHSRLSGYWMACMRTFVNNHGGSFYVVRKKVSANAPFDFENEKGINLFDFSSFSGSQLMNFCKDKNPDLVYVSGWSENSYLKVCRYFLKKDIPVVCGLDNHWKGSIRQILGKYFLRYVSPNNFSHLWISGLYQFEYARHLGFRKKNILTGVYSADVNAFSQFRKISRDKAYPKSFLYVGRFIERKGILELAEAFQKIKDSTGTDWTLTLVGNGPLKNELKKFDSISVLDFVQPDKLPELMGNHGVFVLPSKIEPWGVVIHEASASGLPILSTFNCGAATAFIRNGYNGYVTNSENVDDLHHSLMKFIGKNDTELYQMGDFSYELSRQFTPRTWASTLRELIK